MAERNGYLTVTYVKLMRYQCANPECDSGFNVQGHHITPLGHGGEDSFWNIVALCRQCHMVGTLHTEPERHIDLLNIWKCQQERRVLGFYMDEYEDHFIENYHRALKEAEIDLSEARSGKVDLSGRLKGGKRGYL